MSALEKLGPPRPCSCACHLPDQGHMTVSHVAPCCTEPQRPLYPENPCRACGRLNWDEEPLARDLVAYALDPKRTADLI